jgi:hypothetical protein
VAKLETEQKRLNETIEELMAEWELIEEELAVLEEAPVG